MRIKSQLNAKLFFAITLIWLFFVSAFYIIFNYIDPKAAADINFLIAIIIVLSTSLLFCFSWLFYIYVIKFYHNTAHNEGLTDSNFSDKQVKDIKKFILSKAGITAKKYEYFYDIVRKIVRDAKRNNKLLAILFVHIEHTNTEKAKSKSFDKIIKEVTEIANNILRSGDVVAHVEKDKFIVLLSDIKQAKFAGPIAEKILEAADEVSKKYNLNSSIKISIGISVYPNDAESEDQLHKKAQIALYKAKQSEKWDYLYYKEDMNRVAREHVKLRRILQHAIKGQQLSLNFQPQLSLHTNHVKRVEALVRLNDPVMGNIKPSVFIPLAEEIGLYSNIGNWVIRESCKSCKQWQDKGYAPVSVCVNISNKQFYSDDLYQVITGALLDAKLEAKYLELEITETVIMNDINIAIERLQRLHKLGVQIAIDDFGTGYTSINYLKKLPVNVLKIDKSFIRDLPHNKNDIAITNAMISLSHNLGIEVVAEGVEREEQFQYLKKIKCDLIQGYLVSMPVPSTDLVKFLDKQ